MKKLPLSKRAGIVLARAIPDHTAKIYTINATLFDRLNDIKVMPIIDTNNSSPKQYGESLQRKRKHKR